MAKIAEVQEVAVSSLVPYERNAKKHGEDQIEKLKASIQEFGFLTPCLIDRDYNIIAGHGRVLAAQELGIEKVPCVFVEGLTDEQRRAYILVDNKIGELAGWDFELLEGELGDITDIDMSSFGFELDSTHMDFDGLFADAPEKEKQPKTVQCPNCGEVIEI